MLSKSDMKKAMNYPLSDTDIQRVLSPNTTNIISYPDLIQIDDINQVFDELGRCVIFIPLSKTFGHWCCLIRKANTIEWFDPYALEPDAEKEFISEKTLVSLHEQKPLLTNLLRKAYQNGMKIIFNHYHWQADKAGVSDCGRYVAWRCLKYKYSLKQMDDAIKESKMTPDEYVTQFIYDILGK